MHAYTHHKLKKNSLCICMHAYTHHKLKKNSLCNRKKDLYFFEEYYKILSKKVK